MSLSEEQKVWLARYSGYKGENFDEEIDIDKRLLVIRTAEEVEKSTLQRVHLDQMRFPRYEFMKCRDHNRSNRHVPRMWLTAVRT